jgi:hypothetical protein
MKVMALSTRAGDGTVNVQRRTIAELANDDVIDQPHRRSGAKPVPIDQVPESVRGCWLR